MPNPIQNAIAMLGPKERRQWHREYEKERMRAKPFMQEVKVPEDMAEQVLGIWQSQNFGAIAWAVPGNSGIVCRLTVNRRELEADGGWKDGITWDELQGLKNECGYGNHDALEVYPRDANLVNVSSMRHLWILKDPLNFGLHIG